MNEEYVQIIIWKYICVINIKKLQPFALASGSVGWSIIPYTKKLQVWFQVRAHKGGDKFLSLTLFVSNQ